MDVLFLFEALDQSALANISKAYGGIFAVVQMFHLLAMALLGGMILVCDLRLLGLILTDISSERICKDTQKWFDAALCVMLISGIFMSSAVALKLYYNAMFWSKMSGLALGVFFVYAIRRPLLGFAHSSVNPWALKSVALSSLIIWFSVAASGRWIGFS
ncbi:MAG: hypothetical protein HN856_16750 [Gammaproteobacteria bacterium]|jgi:hypothetical protein|nr:hypothetical protein [Gammaproteobacteria bacterium]MCH1550000.1 hypothetical protein [Pseudomonadales bacterium]